MKNTLYSIFACTLFLCSAPFAQTTPNTQNTQVDLIYFGNTFGVSAHRSYSDIHKLRVQDQGLKVHTQGPYAYACGGFTLVGDGPLTVIEFEDALAYFLSPDVISTKPGTANGYISQFETVVMPDSRVLLTAPHGALAPIRWRIKTRPAQPKTRLFYDDATPLNNLTLKCAQSDAWQIRFATHALTAGEMSKPVLFVRRPFGDGVARTEQLMAYLQKRASDRPIVVSAGNNFEGLSFLHPNSPDRQRTNTLKSLELLKTDVLMMGQSEQRFGVEAFKESVKSARINAIETLGTTVKIIGDKTLLLVNLNPGNLSVPEYTQALAKLTQQSRVHTEGPPDLIIGIGALGDAYAHALDARDFGLDVIIGQFKGRPYVEQNMQFEVNLPIRTPLKLLPVGQTCWGELSLSFTSHNTLSVSQRTHPIFSSSHGLGHEAVNGLSKRINQVRQAAFKTTQVQFLREIPNRFKSKDGWRTLSVKAYQSHMKADIAAIGTYPVRWSIQSPVLRLNAIANLPIPHSATIVTIGGAELKKALAKGFFTTLIVSGLEPTTKKVGGRLINHRRSYSLATTPHIADALVKTVKINGRTDLTHNNASLTEQPDPFVQTIILNSMPKTLEQLPPNLTPPTKVPEWFLDLSQLTLEGGRLHRVGTPNEYSDVSEPRLTIKDHQQVAIKGHLAVGYDSDGLSAVNYVDWAFAQSYLQDSPAQETDDRLNIGNELVFNQFQILGNRAAPFFRTAYLTEFTAADIEGPNRRKQRLESVLGSLWRWDKKNQARLGLSVAADLATESATPQYGMYGQFELQKRVLGFDSFARGELRYLPPMLQQLDSRQLQLYGDAEVGLLLPVWHRLSIRTYLGGFYYQSDERFARTPGLNIRGGVALNLDHFMPL